MVSVKKEGILLHKTDLEFENDGVLNPGVIQEGNTVHMFYRAVKKGNYSTLGYCRFEGPLELVERYSHPVWEPLLEFESHGVEDCRIVKIDDLYYLTYTGYNGVNGLGALATSTDLKHFERYGIIVPQVSHDEFQSLVEHNELLNQKYLRQHRHFGPADRIFIWDKNVMFFPRRINGKLAFLHRIKPGIQLVMVNDLSELTPDYWTGYLRRFKDHIVMDPILDAHESSYIGGGCPPIETEMGWLTIYHGVKDTPAGYVYSACAALLDLENPVREIARLPYALFTPEYAWELHGVVPRVVFPTGTSIFGETLYIYYGAADNQIACASLNLKELINELVKHIK